MGRMTQGVGSVLAHGHHSPWPWAIISSSLQDSSRRWRVDDELRDLKRAGQLGIRATADDGSRFAEGARGGLRFWAGSLKFDHEGCRTR